MLYHKYHFYFLLMNHVMKTFESTKGKSTRFHISIQISNNRSSHIRILSFQGENEEAMKGADGKDV